MADWEQRFAGYIERLGDVLGHADRRAPLRAYATGLLLPGERKSLEPIAARVEPFRVGAAHRSLQVDWRLGDADGVGDARGGFRGAAAAGRAARRGAAGGARAGLGVRAWRARGGPAAGGGLRRGPALPALRRGGTAAALGSCERAAPLSLQGLPQDLQRPDRHLPGAAAQEGALAGLR